MVKTRATLWIAVLLVLLPLGSLIWAGARLMESQGAALREEEGRLITGRLDLYRGLIAKHMAMRERALLSATEWPRALDPETLRAAARKTPGIGLFYALGPEGELLYPAPQGPWSEAERAFLERMEKILENRDLLSASGAMAEGEGRRDHGWLPLYWERGLHLLFWRRDRYDRIVGAEIPRIRLLSELVGILPAESRATLPNEAIALLDEQGEPVVQWGNTALRESRPPRLLLPLRAPLGGWQLAYTGRNGLAASERQMRWWFALAVLGLGGMLSLLAARLVREQRRALREAAQRVDFVSQVSHELKTPLTNIRLYAEMLGNDLDPEAPEQKRLGVILAESERLSRLIHNVLTFSREQRGLLELAPRVVDPDEALRRVIAQFTLALERRGIAVTTDLRASGSCRVDPDALEQIVGNLLGNAEKYAPNAPLAITSRREREMLIVTVADGGPGIPPAKREALFLPFVRLSEALTEGVAGTGIGLSISRALARRHGGDVVIVASEYGSCFEVRLREI